MVTERDVLGLPRASALRRRRPCWTNSRGRRAPPAAEEPLRRGDGRRDPDDRGVRRRVQAAKRLGPRSNGSCATTIAAHSGSQGNWRPEDLADVKAELKRLKERASLGKSVRRGRQLALRDRLADSWRVRGREGRRRGRGLTGPVAQGAGRPGRLGPGAPLFPAPSSTASWSTSSRTPIRCRPRSSCSSRRTRPRSGRGLATGGAPGAGQALRRRRPEAVDLPVPARRPPDVRGGQALIRRPEGKSCRSRRTSGPSRP